MPEIVNRLVQSDDVVPTGGLDDVFERYREKIKEAPKGGKPVEESIWEEDPVDFRTYVVSKRFSNHVPLSENQYKGVEDAVGLDPKMVFDTSRVGFKEVIWEWGQGGGKGTVGTLFESWIIYILLCMKSAHRYFGIAIDDTLDLVNVATGSKPAIRLFERLCNRIKRNRWFKERYIIRDEGKIISRPRKSESSGIIIDMFTEYGEEGLTIARQVIALPKNLRAQALSAKTESYEDVTIIFALFDECSGFQSREGFYNADKIYTTLVGKARELPAVILLTSFPRLDEENDFLHARHLKAVKNPSENVYTSRYCTWEVKPAYFFRAGYYDFEIDARTHEKVKVPLVYKQEFDENPEKCKCRYMCRPGGVFERAFFEHTEYLDAAIKAYAPRIKTIPRLRPVQKEVYIEQQIVSISLTPGYQYGLGIDQGESRCETVIAVGHVEKPVDQVGHIITALVVDAIVIYPTMFNNRKVLIDLDNVVQFCKDVNTSTPGQFKDVWADHWNKPSLKMNLLAAGMKVEIYGLKLDDFDYAKSLFYSGRIMLPNCPESEQVIRQLKYLVKSSSSTTVKPKAPAPLLMDAAEALVELCCAMRSVLDLKVSSTVGMAIPIGGGPMSGLDQTDRDQAARLLGLKSVVGSGREVVERRSVGMVLGPSGVRRKKRKR